MKCYAKWMVDQESGLCFRSHTLLQFGDKWDLLANFILMNPGSAEPQNTEVCDQFLNNLKLPYFITPQGKDHYFQFSIDPLMRNLIKMYSQTHDGGVIKIFNLFNLKNQDSNQALVQLSKHLNNNQMFTPENGIIYGTAPVVIATGKDAFNNEFLKTELKKYIRISAPQSLYALQKVNDKQYEVLKAEKNEEGLVESFHPSYTFLYGNSTKIRNTI